MFRTSIERIEFRWQFLAKGQYISNTNYSLILQSDGNLTQYFNAPNGTRAAAFTTRTTNGEKLFMQNDGNLALYTGGMTWAWTSQSGGQPIGNFKLVMYETGRIAILDGNGGVLKVLNEIDKVQSWQTAVFPFRKVQSGPNGVVACVDGFTPQKINGAEANTWAISNGGSIGYCNSPY
ncbi:hypothetical protein [Duganella hordei]|uniref:hypothetical protein n=1 Tax=Duganella hordei TaxID=2865934 RepID=UPI0030E92B87